MTELALETPMPVVDAPAEIPVVKIMDQPVVYLEDYTTTTDSTFTQDFDCRVNVKCRDLSEEQVLRLARCEITRKMNAKLRRAKDKAKPGSDLHTWRLEILTSKEFTFDVNEELSPVKIGAVSTEKAIAAITTKLLAGNLTIIEVDALMSDLIAAKALMVADADSTQ